MPEKIDKYEIKSIIGQGGMGKIFKAVDPDTKKNIIIKQLLICSQAVLTKRFQREANVMMAFNHRNIVKVFNQFKRGKSYFIAMEFVDGMSLEELIEKKKKIDTLPAILIFREICIGLKYAHDNGIIHRDIKPDNVLISKLGDVKLVDFGIATAKPGSEEDLTKTGTVMGTPAYMSPEQIIDSKDVDKRCDIYSMGVLFYQMVTGKKPFSSSFSAETLNSITKGIYENPAKIIPDIPGVFKKIIKKTMNCKKNNRFKDLKECISILTKYSSSFKNNSQIKNAIRKYFAGQDINPKEEDATEIDKNSKPDNQKIIKIKLKDIKKNTKISIGRDPANNFVIANDPLVSRKHAIIGNKENTYFITDNNSQNGIMIDNKKIPKNVKYKLKSNILVFLGHTILKII